MTRTTDPTAALALETIALTRLVAAGQDEDLDAAAQTLHRMSREQLHTALITALTLTDAKRVNDLEQRLTTSTGENA